MLWWESGGCVAGVEAREVSLGSGELDSDREEPEPEFRRRCPPSVPPPGVLGVLSPPVAPATLSLLAYHRW